MNRYKQKKTTKKSGPQEFSQLLNYLYIYKKKHVVLQLHFKMVPQNWLVKVQLFSRNRSILEVIFISNVCENLYLSI